MTLNGNGTVTGTFEVEGTLTANSLNIDGLGVAEMNAGTNIVLRAGNRNRLYYYKRHYWLRW